MQTIELQGVRVHNLKNIDLTLPLHRLIAISGVSGSGKSSLAFETLYAEGQRRYIESFSAYARQFLERLERPDADRIDNIPPAIAIRQGARNAGARSTVATATELYDHFGLLYAKIGQIVCPGCRSKITNDSPTTAIRVAQRFPDNTRFSVCFEIGWEREDEFNKALSELKEIGFQRVVLDRLTVTLRDCESLSEPPSSPGWVVVDRLMAGNVAEGRLADSLEQAFRHGGERCLLLEQVDAATEEGRQDVVQIDRHHWKAHRFSRHLHCAHCDRAFLSPEPQLFSFNGPLGACPECHGFGSVSVTGSNRPVPDVCPTCDGTRLQPLALAVEINGLNIAQLCRQSVRHTMAFLDNLAAHCTAAERQVIRVVLDEAQSRLAYLAEAGLSYLTLDRPMKTLSGGEAQRVELAATLGARLVDGLYVLDEPSAGLHPRDNARIIDAIFRLRDAGNSVIVVEHDAAFLRAADEVVDIGPGAGQHGGTVVFQGTPQALAEADSSVTGQFLSGRRVIPAPAGGRRRETTYGWITLNGVRQHTLKNLTVRFPLGVLCAVTGVSGSGKSSLVEETLYPALCGELGQTCAISAEGEFDRVAGADQIAAVVLVDERPIGRTPRSNPITYMKAFDEIRRTFAGTPEAKLRHFTPRHFSFNAPGGGRCPNCQGHGAVTIDMQFLADVSMTCPECHGRRYQREILEAKYRGRTIAEVLAMTVDEAFTFFRSQPKVLKPLKCLRDVGLGYVPLGQPAPTLSGGESQRLKLASFLASGTQSRTLFLLNEPTIGLHPADVQTLLQCFEDLLAVGHSLVVIEHNLDVIKSADFVIDLGPEAGEAGGEIVAQGSPEEICAAEHSITGRYLATVQRQTGRLG